MSAREKIITINNDLPNLTDNNIPKPHAMKTSLFRPPKDAMTKLLDDIKNKTNEHLGKEQKEINIQKMRK